MLLLKIFVIILALFIPSFSPVLRGSVRDAPNPEQDYSFNIINDDKTIGIKFAQETIDDFEKLINDPAYVDQYNNLKSFIDFKLYIELGKASIIRPDFKISQKLLDEKRDLDKSELPKSVVFSDEINKILLEGLIKLNMFLYGTYEAIDLNIPDAVEDKKNVSNLITWYNKNGSFESSGPSKTSLEYLKAAAVIEIIDYEKRKEQEIIERIKKGINEKIVTIVSELRKTPFINIKLPECIKEYAKTQDSMKTINGVNLEMFKNIVPFASNKKVFLAHRFDEKDLRNEIEKKLKAVDFELKEGKVEDLGYITEDILNKIKESGFFMVLITPAKKFENGKFSTSSWVLMEIGVAIAYGRKVLILAEDCVDIEEYSGKLQRDCQHEIFNRSEFSDKLKRVIERIKKEYEKK